VAEWIDDVSWQPSCSSLIVVVSVAPARPSAPLRSRASS